MNMPNFTRWAAAAILASAPFFAACSDDDAPQGPVICPVSPGEAFLENDEVLFQCDFQDPVYTKEQFKQYNLSGLTPTSTMQSLHFSADSAWIYSLQDSPESVNRFAGATSSFNGGGAANAWLVTRQITLPATGECVLSWLSESLSLTTPDGLKVFVSTTGGNPETDFTGEPIWQTDSEPAGPSESLDGEWNEHSVSLKDYAGKRVWIAFVNQTEGGLLVCLDDVAVKASTSYYVYSDVEQISTGESVTVRGRVVAKDKPLAGYTVFYAGADSVVHTKTYEGLDIQPGQSHSFSFDEPLVLSDKRGTYVGYRIWTNVGTAEKVGVADSIASVTFIPQNKVVVEEGTGAWCGWCPLGVLAFEHLYEAYPDNFIGIAVHNDDAMAVPEYDGNLQCPAFPLGAINRSYWGEPMVNTNNQYLMDAPGSWKYYVEQELKRIPSFEVRVGNTSLSEYTLQVAANLRFALPVKKPRLRVAYVVTEDNVAIGMAQANYLSSYTLEAFGRFASGQEYGQARIKNFPYQDVAIGIWPAYRGEDITLPSTVPAGASYRLKQTIDLSEAVLASTENLSVTVLIINDADGTILAADRKKI